MLRKSRFVKYRRVLALSLHSGKNELFSDSYRTFKNNTVRIAVSEDFNQNLKYNQKRKSWRLKSILKTEVCPINRIPSDRDDKTVDWFYSNLYNYIYMHIFIYITGNKYNANNIGLYRDDGSTIFNNTSDRNLNKLKRFLKKYVRTKVQIIS